MLKLRRLRRLAFNPPSESICILGSLSITGCGTDDDQCVFLVGRWVGFPGGKAFLFVVVKFGADYLGEGGGGGGDSGG